MTWWKGSRFAQVVAVLLLVLTGADMTNAISCALDDEDALSASMSVTLDLPSSTTPDQSATHIDDCFCCSHCVEVRSVVPALTSKVSTIQPVVLTPLALHNFGAPLYHPPLV